MSTGPSTPSGTPEPIVTRVRIDRVDGALDDSERERLKSSIGEAVDTWIDGAYGGSYPRDDFADAFDSFTEGAALRARQDEDLLSNAGVGLLVDDVRALRRRVRLDVLGVDGTAVAVTARVDLAIELEGEISREDTISGSLYLTYEPADKKSGDPAGWRVFGYDLEREGA